MRSGWGREDAGHTFIGRNTTSNNSMRTLSRGTLRRTCEYLNTLCYPAGTHHVGRACHSNNPCHTQTRCTHFVNGRPIIVLTIVYKVPSPPEPFEAQTPSTRPSPPGWQYPSVPSGWTHPGSSKARPPLSSSGVAGGSARIRGSRRPPPKTSVPVGRKRAGVIEKWNVFM